MSSHDELFESLDAFLQRLMGLVDAESLNFLVDVEMSITQIRMLMLLSWSEPMPIRSVADQLDLSVHAAGRNIDRLVEHGLVERRESSDDRRVKLVSLSPRGLQLVDGHLAARKRSLRKFVDGLPTEQAAALVAALRPILADGYLQSSALCAHHHYEEVQ